MFRFKSIDHIAAKIKALAKKAGILIDRWDVYTACVAVLTGLICLFSGLLWGIHATRPPVRIERFALEMPEKPKEMEKTEPATKNAAAAATSSAASIPAPPSKAASAKTYVASKSGTKYHLPTCAGAKSISEANKVWFATKAEAEKAGYSPAGNCKGI